jgi:hypothetical protein
MSSFYSLLIWSNVRWDEALQYFLLTELRGGHFPLNTPVTVQFSNLDCGPPDYCGQITQTLPTDRVREISVQVPNNLMMPPFPFPSQLWSIGIRQAGVYPVSGVALFWLDQP